jgi:hypothetical protein
MSEDSRPASILRKIVFDYFEYIHSHSFDPLNSLVGTSPSPLLWKYLHMSDGADDESELQRDASLESSKGLHFQYLDREFSMGYSSDNIDNVPAFHRYLLRWDLFSRSSPDMVIREISCLANILRHCQSFLGGDLILIECAALPNFQRLLFWGGELMHSYEP